MEGRIPVWAVGRWQHSAEGRSVSNLEKFCREIPECDNSRKEEALCKQHYYSEMRPLLSIPLLFGRLSSRFSALHAIEGVDGRFCPMPPSITHIAD